MISGQQVKAARMLLSWDVSTLARTASVEPGVVLAIEAGTDKPVEALILIEKTLEAAGVVFPDADTVRLSERPPPRP